MEFILKVDEKGRILIPGEVRTLLNIKGAVHVKVEGDKLIIRPIKDPIEELASHVTQGTTDVEKEIRGLREVALKEALRRSGERL